MWAINDIICAAVEPKAHAVVGFGVVAAGTVVPPKITDFGLYASLDGSLNGTLTVDASASVSSVIVIPSNTVAEKLLRCTLRPPSIVARYRSSRLASLALTSPGTVHTVIS